MLERHTKLKSITIDRGQQREFLSSVLQEIQPWAAWILPCSYFQHLSENTRNGGKGILRMVESMETCRGWSPGDRNQWEMLAWNCKGSWISAQKNVTAGNRNFEVRVWASRRHLRMQLSQWSVLGLIIIFQILEKANQRSTLVANRKESYICS